MERNGEITFDDDSKTGQAVNVTAISNKENYNYKKNLKVPKENQKDKN